MKTAFFSFLFIGTLLNSTYGLCQEQNHKNDPEMKRNTIFIGTYTQKEGHVDGKAKGIYTLYQNPKNGAIRFGETVAKITNPSYVIETKDGKNLYAVSELTKKDAASGFIYSYKINEDDSLTQIGKISTESFAPCHIAVDKTGKFVFVSNYVGGVVVMYQRKNDGTLVKKQQLDFENPKISHPHSVSISADNRTAYIADLGNDKIWIYNFDAEKGMLSPHEQVFIALEKGSGPRHLAFSKKNDFLYSINELNNSVSVFKILNNSGLKFVQNISSLPKDFSGKSAAAEIQVHPSGNFLYVSNRWHDSIASFKIDPATGKLTLLEFTSTRGKTPRNFEIGPGGKYMYVANQDSGSISTFKIDSETGKLEPILEPIEVKSPVCIEF